MKCYRIPKSILIYFLILGFLVACKTGSQSANAIMVGQIKTTNPDKEAIYGILANLKDYINSSQWDKWLSLYTDDAILTVGQKQFNKMEMRRIVDGKTYKITEMEILKKNIGKEQAFVSVRVIGNGKKRFGTYEFKKFDGKWLITEETNSNIKTSVTWIKWVDKEKVSIRWDPVTMMADRSSIHDGYEIKYLVYIDNFGMHEGVLVEKYVDGNWVDKETPIAETGCTISFKDKGKFVIGVQSVLFDEEKQIKERSSIAWSDYEISTNSNPFAVRSGK